MAIRLDDLQGGVLSEKINYELSKIFDNILDPNTDQGKARSLSISLKFKPSKNGTVELVPSLKSNLAPIETDSTTLIVERDIKTGKVVAEEWNRQVKGQISIDEIDEKEKTSDEATENKVIDLRASK